MQAQSPRADFFEAIRDKQEFTISGRLVSRAKFGKHLLLANLSEKIFDSLTLRNLDEVVQNVEQYLVEYDYDFNEYEGVEKLLCFIQLYQINSLKFKLPFLEVEDDPDSKSPSYSYSGRLWAYWIHKVAKAYSWTKDKIFSLWPEEFLCYLQEIIIDEFETLEMQRQLSEVAYSYDKVSQKYNYIPLPRPNWMLGKKPIRQKKEIRIPTSALPVGMVINLNENKEQIH